ncbi:MAG: hypothetical protein A3I04_04110 [Nitrospinae bacterium RIFCSPLOWO2_02_FULL_39_110]|nr:MAG: hypothetical protein A2W53_06165 [Nitrospinae bacterium RIFCSPHIGHO2_02_39_11]OGW00316.1 MAG: hypothetical protein A3D20_02840 [Nitrospinae bacterium RIFCSPHIGHO2_02_FULL_39_82]OGW02466.1 MAG: hypothetical protein A2Z59_10310 [Nitrospinae bacterium RIFCSPLOWO2_02_39_17]OGW07108.1 MAG: hypothetical protein A3I04_04110 [Nitrospinae bacterium RIFCSPLOWO2_02_FULL_39_110]OGW11853.1 MAG: hypothetical protein A3F81_02770 [Nitrospinae bacterium RIFCSPLOWO2_12_FULL_39_93]OGW11953.1 MAG: hypothe
MGKINYPQAVRLFAGLIYQDDEIAAAVKKRLKDEFSEICNESNVIQFDFTDYYNKEMGNDLKREFICFRDLIKRDKLAEIKIKTNEIESDFADPSTGNRHINIDPGYISAENVILATTKNWGHRPYLKDGIYAELTYRFQKGSLNPLEWTYPDYRTKGVISIFNEWRKSYLKELSDLSRIG